MPAGPGIPSSPPSWRAVPGPRRRSSLRRAPALSSPASAGGRRGVAPSRWVRSPRSPCYRFGGGAPIISVMEAAALRCCEARRSGGAWCRSGGTRPLRWPTIHFGESAASVSCSRIRPRSRGGAELGWLYGEAGPRRAVEARPRRWSRLASATELPGDVGAGTGVIEGPWRGTKPRKERARIAGNGRCVSRTRPRSNASKATAAPEPRRGVSPATAHAQSTAEERRNVREATAAETRCGCGRGDFFEGCETRRGECDGRVLR